MLLCVNSVPSVVYSTFQFQFGLLSDVLSVLGSCVTHRLLHILRCFLKRILHAFHSCVEGPILSQAS